MAYEKVRQTVEHDGRLHAAKVRWPLSRPRFEQLCAHWRSSGLWLSLWDQEGEPARIDDQANGPWRSLWSAEGDFRRDLTRIAGEVLRGGGQPGDPPAAVEAASWRPLVTVLAFPVWRRRRKVGVVLACAVLPHTRMGEDFLRLCDQWGVDSAALATQFDAVPPISAAALKALSGLLSLTLEQAREIEIKASEARILTDNLEHTYEELSLIYRVSGGMALAQPPRQMLEDVGRQLLEASRAVGVAFVLSPQEPSRRLAGSGATEAKSDAGDHIICSGDVRLKPNELSCLAYMLNKDLPPGTPHLLMNHAVNRPELQWLRHWLDHLAAMPLWQGEQLLGLMLMLNCRDEGDFTSVDLQLFRAVADRVAISLENQYLYDDLADLLLGLMHSLVSSIDAKDPYTCGHSERVASFSRALAQAAGMSPVECERVYLSGLLHDVGKIGVPDSVLTKSGKLTIEEFDVLKKHPEIGVRILSRVRQIRDLMPGVLYHHERMDGRGYPAGLSGERIPLLGRIICIADSFDAMTTNRTYRAALPLPLAVAEIRRCAGTQFDPRLAECFLKLNLAGMLSQSRSRVPGDPLIGQVQPLATFFQEQSMGVARLAEQSVCLVGGE